MNLYETFHIAHSDNINCRCFYSLNEENWNRLADSAHNITLFFRQTLSENKKIILPATHLTYAVPGWWSCRHRFHGTWG